MQYFDVIFERFDGRFDVLLFANCCGVNHADKSRTLSLSPRYFSTE